MLPVGKLPRKIEKQVYGNDDDEKCEGKRETGTNGDVPMPPE